MSKRILCLTLLLLLLTLAACGSPADSELPVQGCLEELDWERLTRPGAEGADSAYQTAEYYGLSDMLLALEADRADFLLIPFAATADYLTARDSDLARLDTDTPCSVRMGVLPDNTLLCSRLNEAIAALTADGTVERLVEEHITGAIPGSDPEVTEPPYVDGADVLKVGVTGDLPPLDYISADGTPAGFNTALLSAIGQYLNINVQLVSVTAPARLTALSAGTIDVAFWVVDHQGAGGDGSLLCTEPYYSDHLTYLTDDYPVEQLGELLAIAN